MSNPYIHFTNRQRELDILLNEDGLRVALDAPSGFGKSALLLKAKESLDGANDLHCVYVDLKKYSSKETDHLIKGFLDDLVMSVSNETKIRDLTLQADDCYEAFRNAASMKGLVILLDSVERCDDQLLRYIVNEFLPRLTNDMVTTTFRVVVAGRYLERRTNDHHIGIKQFRPDWRRDYVIEELKPFGIQTIEKLVKERFNKSRPDNNGLTSSQFRAWSRDILKLSGGHPKTIVSLIDHLADPRLGNWSLNLSDRSRQIRLFDTYVARELNSLLEEVPSHLRLPLEYLSVFRKFTSETLTVLHDEKKLSLTNAPLAIFRSLVETGLVARKDMFYSDGLVRDLLLTRLRVKDSAKYVELNLLALKIIEDHINDAIKQGSKSVFGFSVAETVPVYVKEAIYHLSQLIEYDNSSEPTKTELIQKKITMYREFLRAIPENENDAEKQIITCILDHEIEQSFFEGRYTPDRILEIAFKLPSTQEPISQPNVLGELEARRIALEKQLQDLDAKYHEGGEDIGRVSRMKGEVNKQLAMVDNQIQQAKNS